MPFIKPPIGPLRFSPPLPADPWSGVVETRKWKPGCPQRCILPPGTCPPETSEDCVYLNVFTPRAVSARGERLPVMVFLPGGHFDQGMAGGELYDGGFIANRTGVVVVTVGYRLGALGWATDAAAGLTGNYGLMDQRMGLKWVQRNIAAFGGDPGRVTLFGQSAGATSIAAHLVSPLSEGLFHRAILQSNPFTLPMRPTNDASVLGAKFNKLLGCDSVDCLRTKSIDDILDAQYTAADKFNLTQPLVRFLPWVPTIDGSDQVPLQFIDAVAEGKFHKMPMMMGTTAEEALLFIYMASNNKTVSDAAYVLIVSAVFRLHAPKVLVQYPPKPIIGDKRPQVSVLGSDYIFRCSTRFVASSVAKFNEGMPVYLYDFNQTISFDAWGPFYWYCHNSEGRAHACHGADLPYVWHASGNSTFTRDEEILSRSVIDYWTNFAKTGDPNAGATVPVQWPAFDPREPRNIEFEGDKTRIVNRLRGAQCDFWDKMGYHHGW